MQMCQGHTKQYWDGSQSLVFSRQIKNPLAPQDGWQTIIDEAQKLVHPISGFQSVACGLTMNFEVMTREFIHILHTGISHWVTVSMIGTIHQLSVSMIASTHQLVQHCSPRLPAFHLHRRKRSPWSSRMCNADWDKWLNGLRNCLCHCLGSGEAPRVLCLQSAENASTPQEMPHWWHEHDSIHQSVHVQCRQGQGTTNSSHYCSCRMPSKQGKWWWNAQTSKNASMVPVKPCLQLCLRNGAVASALNYALNTTQFCLYMTDLIHVLLCVVA